MKINKKLIKELVDNLEEFKLTELEYSERDTKIKVSRQSKVCLLYTSPSPRDRSLSRMPSSA